MVAPRTPTTAEAKAWARARVFSMDQPCSRPRMTTLVNASPAPTVSVTGVSPCGAILAIASDARAQVDLPEKPRAKSASEQEDGENSARHLLELGVRPGPAMGSLLKRVYEQQLDGTITTLDDAVEAAKGILRMEGDEPS